MNTRENYLDCGFVEVEGKPGRLIRRESQSQFFIVKPPPTPNVPGWGIIEITYECPYNAIYFDASKPGAPMLLPVKIAMMLADWLDANTDIPYVVIGSDHNNNGQFLATDKGKTIPDGIMNAFNPPPPSG